MELKYYLKRLTAAFIDVTAIATIMWIYVELRNVVFEIQDDHISSFLFIPFFYLYFIISESIFRSTIGKRIFNLRVNSTGRFHFLSIIIRNSLNFLEMIIPFIYLIPLIITGMGEKKKPRKIGDLLAKTRVE